MSPALECRPRTMAEAVRDLGASARKRGESINSNPYTDPALRAGWAEGWNTEDARLAQIKERHHA